jgi:pre-mRNA-splicing factor 38A
MTGILHNMSVMKNEDDRVYPSWSHTQNYKRAVRGMAPQHLVDTITRHKIYNSVYWQQYCFGVNLVTLVDRAQLLKGIGGLYGTMKQPCEFYCLFLKLLELEPSEAVIDSFLSTRTWQMKHLRMLASLYVRFTYPPESVYLILEPLLCHYNKIAVLKDDGYSVQHFDEIIHCFLKDKFWCGITFPPLTPRGELGERLSPLRHLTEQLKKEVYEGLGMTPDGVLLEQVAEKKRLRIKGLKLKSGKKKEKQPVQSLQDELEEENKLRISLGLPPLK